MKGREKMNNLIATLEIIRYVSAVALCVSLVALVIYGLYRNIKETAEDTVREELERAVREAGRPVVKVEVEMKGKW